MRFSSPRRSAASPRSPAAPPARPARRRPANLAGDAAAGRPGPCRPTNLGPRAGHRGRGPARSPSSPQRIPARRAAAGQQRQLVPGRAAGRDHRAGQPDAPRHRRHGTDLTFAYRTDYIGASYRAQPQVAVGTARSSSSATASTRPSAAGTTMPASTSAARRWSSWSTIPTGRRRASKARSTAGR